MSVVKPKLDDNETQTAEGENVESSVCLLQKTLASCSSSIQDGDYSRSEKSISGLVNFLGSISDSEPENEDSEAASYELLSEIYRYITSPSLEQAVLDALSFELPKAVARFSGASKRCMQIAVCIINQFVLKCSPRDMLAILCEALDSPGTVYKTACYSAPILSGLTKVFISIQRRQFEHIKAAIPVILRVLKVICLESDEEDYWDSGDLFNILVRIANSIQAICDKLEGNDKEKLRALFGLFILQIMAFASISMKDDVMNRLPLMKNLSQFLTYCGLSPLGLITGVEIDMITSVAFGESDNLGDGDDCLSCLEYVKHGAVLSVILDQMLDEVDLVKVKNELQINQIKRWEAVSTIKHVLSCVNLPWKFKKDSINFLLCILEPSGSHKANEEHNRNQDFAHYIPSFYASLQAVQMVIIYASDPALRKNAFDAFKRVLADIPPSARFDILLALIKNSDSSSMIAILLGCVKDEMLREIRQMQSQNSASTDVYFWRPEVLELVDLILRPFKASLPEFTDAVLSALNLYRFVLITESTGKTNHTGVLSKEKLQKAKNEWLMPLRSLVSGIVSETRKEAHHRDYDALCSLNPLEFVLYRCIELVEENLKDSK